MKCCVVFTIFYISGVYCANVSVEHPNVTACDEEDIEYLDLEKVVNLAVNKENCRNEAMEIIDRKYNFTGVYIDTVGFDITDRILRMAYDRMPSRFWTVFGHLIDSLRFSCFAYDRIDPQQVVADIAPLRSLQFDYFERCKFFTTKPYETVERLAVDDSTPTGPAPLDYGQIFPDVQILHTLKGYPFLLNGRYSQLTVFEADSITNGNFVQFFTNNPQIRTMSVFESSMGYLKAAQDLLPQLENFTFVVPKDFQSYNGPKFVFPKVKSLLIKDEFQTFDHSKFTFASLEQLTIDMGGVQLIENEWFRFIENHTHLKSIKTTERAYFHANGLLKLFKAANLVEADIFGGPRIEVEHIATFVKNSENLQRFKLNFLSSFSSYDEYLRFVVSLRDELDEKWKLNQADRNFSGYKYIELINLEKNATNGQA